MQRHAPRAAEEASECVIRGNAGAVVATQKPPTPSLAGQREQERHGTDEVRSEAGGKQPSLVQSFMDQAQIELLQVAQAAVDKFAGSRRRTRGKVARLNEGHRQAARSGIDRGTGARDTATNDQDVEPLPAQACQVGPASLGRQVGRGNTGH